MIYIDKYACFSALKDTNPLLKILFGGMSLIVCVCSVSIVSYMIVFTTMFYATVFKGKIPPVYYLKLMLLPLGFLVLGVIAVVIDITYLPSPNNVIAAMRFGDVNVYISEAGFVKGFMLVSKSLAAASCLYFIVLTTPFNDIVSFLRVIKCPRSLVTLAAMTYQFIFLLLDIVDTKLKSQICRGGYRDFMGFAKTFAILWGSVFVQSMLKSEWTFKSMQTRGFDGQLKSMPVQFHITVTEIVLLTVFLAMIIVPNFINVTFW